MWGAAHAPHHKHTSPRSVILLRIVKGYVVTRGLASRTPFAHNTHWCTMHDRQLPAMDASGAIRAHATTSPRSPSDVLIVAGEPAHGPATTAEAQHRTSVAVARANHLALVTWLVAALNATLAGAPLPQPRPAGTLIERGRFVAEGNEVWARDWYDHGRGCVVMCCPDEGSAATLAQQLEAVLGGR